MSVVEDVLTEANTTIFNVTVQNQDAQYQHADSMWWLLGVALAVFAAFFSNLGYTLQKMQHVKQSDEDEIQHPYYMKPLWRLGLFLVVFASIADFSALSFAAQSVVAPLGSLTLVSNLIFAKMLLKEKTTLLDVVATGTIVIGSSVAVSFAPHKELIFSGEDLFSFFWKPAFEIYMIFVINFCLIGYIFIRKMEDLETRNDVISRAKLARLRPWQRFAYPSTSGCVGALSVLFAKCTVELLAETLSGKFFMFAHIRTYLVLLALSCSIFMQIKWLNDGLARFDATYTVPVFSAFWINFSVISGMIFFQEYAGMTPSSTVLFIVGVCVTTFGVLLLSRRSHPVTPFVALDSAGEVDNEIEDSAAIAIAVASARNMHAKYHHHHHHHHSKEPDTLSSSSTSSGSRRTPASVEERHSSYAHSPHARRHVDENGVASEPEQLDGDTVLGRNVVTALVDDYDDDDLSDGI